MSTIEIQGRGLQDLLLEIDKGRPDGGARQKFSQDEYCRLVLQTDNVLEIGQIFTGNLLETGWKGQL